MEKNVGDNSELQKLYTFLKDRCGDIIEVSANKGILYYGGPRVAGVESIKFHLKRAVVNVLITFEQYTLLER